MKKQKHPSVSTEQIEAHKEILIMLLIEKMHNKTFKKIKIAMNSEQPAIEIFKSFGYSHKNQKSATNQLIVAKI